MKFDTSQPPPASAFMKGLVLMLIGNFLMAWVLAHDIAAWNPVSWGKDPVPEMEPMFMAVMGAFFTWLGFFLPGDLSRLGWENKSVKLFFINTSYHFLTLLVASLIIAGMNGRMVSDFG